MYSGGGRYIAAMLLLLACDFSAATKVTGDSADSGWSDADTDTDGDTDADTDADTDTDTDTTDPFEIDDDGDGFSETDGDCDDEDRTVFPGAEDVCNGVDDDCDDEVDEDASPDAWEPNDDDAADLGNLDDDPELSAVGSLAGDDDVDRFAFSFTDSAWSLFEVTATLDDIPDHATYRFTLNRLSSDGDLPAEEIDQVFGTGSLTLSMSDVSFQEDGGTYELVVEAIAGADCGRSYLLAVAW